MSNILIDLLPSKVNIKGIEYEIRSDFRISILFSLLMEDNNISEDEKVIQALKLYYPVVPNDMNAAVDKILWFYRCGKIIHNSKGKGKSNKKVFDYEADANYIYSAFMSQYRIDLQDIKELHWWKFKALLESLNSDNKFNEIIKYRSIDTSKIEDKEQKKFYKDMQKFYSLENDVDPEEKKEIDKWNDFLKQK